ncbi:MAG: DUF4440 domain-containing protein [Saprospiraceae bacterium]|nr:DUF4440 domain-containing protein [Saprospiraceae bacterium]
MNDRIINGYFLLVFLIIHAGCASDPASRPAADPAELVAADSAFCQRSLEAGMKVAFVEYADSAVIKMDDGQPVIRGIQHLQTLWADPRPDGPSPLVWAPQHAEVAASGDLGYTFGYWRFPGRTDAGTDTLYYGNYVSIWKRQTDGSWKYVLDTGTNTPKPDDWE